MIADQCRVPDAAPPMTRALLATIAECSWHGHRAPRLEGMRRQLAELEALHNAQPGGHCCRHRPRTWLCKRASCGRPTDARRNIHHRLNDPGERRHRGITPLLRWTSNNTATSAAGDDRRDGTCWDHHRRDESAQRGRSRTSSTPDPVRSIWQFCCAPTTRSSACSHQSYRPTRFSTRPGAAGDVKEPSWRLQHPLVPSRA